MTAERLHKVMAARGAGSRRACEELIAQGRVEVDGQVVTRPGTTVDPATQIIRCDGELLRPEPPLYFLLNKPRGAICSTASAPGTPRAIDSLPPRWRDRRVFSVGRLDVDSDGALILTNDGDLTHLLTHPSFGVEKTYRVEIDGKPDDATLERMGKGVWLAEGRTGPLDIGLIYRGPRTTTLTVRINEGKQREIRRVCARFGHEVRRLTRLAIGPIQLGDLKSGELRVLSPREVAALRESAQAVIRLGQRVAPGRGSRRKGGGPRPEGGGAKPERRRES